MSQQKNGYKENSGKTYSDSDEIACPHCGQMITGLWEYGDDEWIETECGWCEKPIMITIRITYHYTATKNE